MTNHPNPNSAAQAATNNTAKHVLTDDEINTACDWPAANTTMRAENDRAMAREVEAAVLRKLRAPVADERALPPLPHVPTSYLQLKNLDKIHGMMRDYARFALASAPVAKPKRAPLDDWRVQAIAECLETEWNDMTPASAEADARLIVGYLIAYEKESNEIEARHAAEPVDPVVQAVRNLRASAPVAGDRCKRCGGPGWYTSHTTGYPESIPCSACNPQGVSVGRLEKDPFLAAQLWRKPVDFAGAYEGAREDLAIWKRRAREAERDLRTERETSSRLVAALNAENGPTHMGEPAPQASAEAVRNAALEEAAQIAENSYSDAHIRIRALKQPQAAQDGSQQCVGGADVGRLLTAAKGMTKLYGHVWDRADGALVVFPENVARFDAAFDALRAAVGEVVDDATQPEQGERDGQD
ncbi:hypothetical protein I6I07_15785 [Achromobacter deleyi]|uniref:Uncharacterized protein n=1 Tax=Achromobacter deleyi TaxID=1353891 RepID=A0A7T4B8X9_9BURK|nr:hypothetical protein [Achromobacter deleyi]QQB37946.1 hypothetical protein I6I07_15785 [Achromobacter deleyi]